jgi:arsenate reductase
MRVINVLFLCTGNSARSQMAEAFLRKHGGEAFAAFSAGLEARGIHPLTVAVMREIGISLDGQWSKNVTEYLGKEHFGYLITVCDRAEKECPTVFPNIGQRLHWSFPDPVAVTGPEEVRLDVFRQVRDAIERKVQTWIASLA